MGCPGSRAFFDFWPFRTVRHCEEIVCIEDVLEMATMSCMFFCMYGFPATYVDGRICRWSYLAASSSYSELPESASCSPKEA